MSRWKWVLLVGFVLAFAGGAVIGVQWHGRPQPAPGREGGWLTAELQLTPEQSEQVRKIWSEGMRTAFREHEEKRRAMRQERDEAIAALIRPEDRTSYQQILDRYAAQNAQLGQERSKAFEAAVEKTRQLLTESQKQKYEELLKKRSGERRGRGGTSRRADTRPAATQMTH